VYACTCAVRARARVCVCIDRRNVRPTGCGERARPSRHFSVCDIKSRVCVCVYNNIVCEVFIIFFSRSLFQFVNRSRRSRGNGGGTVVVDCVYDAVRTGRGPAAARVPDWCIILLTRTSQCFTRSYCCISLNNVFDK